MLSSESMLGSSIISLSYYYIIHYYIYYIHTHTHEYICAYMYIYIYILIQENILHQFLFFAYFYLRLCILRLINVLLCIYSTLLLTALLFFMCLYHFWPVHNLSGLKRQWLIGGPTYQPQICPVRTGHDKLKHTFSISKISRLSVTCGLQNLQENYLNVVLETRKYKEETVTKYITCYC